MSQQQKSRKGGRRKIGRSERKPGAAVRKIARRDLFKKARNVAKSSGLGAKNALAKWRNARKKAGDPMAVVDAAIKAAL
jgi:hypothetical protein